jgi:hypothetical protein
LAARDNRLGVVMFRAQRIFDGGSVSFIYAPKLHKPPQMGALAGPFDPKIDQTNGADRFLTSFGFEWQDFSPQFLVYHESGRTKFGLNLSHPIGESIIAYASWAGGVAPNQITDAVAFGKRTGTLPGFATVPPSTDTSRAFRTDLSVGASWTNDQGAMVVLEYEFHQAGFSKRDWRTWFAFGADPMVAPEAWFVRGYIGDLQDNTSQHQIFAMASFFEPFDIKHFNVNGFLMTSLLDGSSLGQFSASYTLSDNWSFGAYLGGSIGGRRSEWGSLPSAGSAIFQVVRYF